MDDAEFEMRAGSKSGKRFPKYALSCHRKGEEGLKQMNYMTTRALLMEVAAKHPAELVCFVRMTCQLLN